MSREESMTKINDDLVLIFELVLKEQEKRVSRLANKDLTIAEIHTLAAVGNIGPTAMKNVAKKLRITLSTLTTAVNKLESKGLVEKIRDKKDKRIVEVGLTVEGKEITEKHNQVHSEMVGTIVKDLTEEEMRILGVTTSRVLEYFDN